MVTLLLTVLGIALFFGVLRVIARPRTGFWNNFLSIFFIDVILDFIENLIDNLDDMD